jgi:DNA mismatch endonuclease, patch repair protein
MDTLTVAERSIRMSKIRSKDTKPELRVRSLLHGLGYRYRLHRRDLPGSPDVVFPARAKIIFVHGCFWHAHQNCRVANKPKSHHRFWNDKFENNVSRDKTNQQLLRRAGWDVCVVWECETHKMAPLGARLLRFLGKPGTSCLKRNHHGTK